MDLQVNFTGFEQRLCLQGVPTQLKIFDGSGKPPPGFNGVAIPLNLSESSLLNWQGALAQATEYSSEGLWILWELNFDLFSGSLEDEARFLTLALNIEHFNAVVWERFQPNSIGAALYRGELELASAQASFSYLKSLAALLPSEVSCFLLLDIKNCQDPLHFFNLLNPELWGSFLPIVKGSVLEQYPYAFPLLSWESGASPLGFVSDKMEASLKSAPFTQALCLPRQIEGETLYPAIEPLKGRPLRVIHENYLTQQWEGVEDLLIFPQRHPDSVWRQIRGFEAAGGRIINYLNDAKVLQPQETFPFSSPVSSR